MLDGRDGVSSGTALSRNGRVLWNSHLPSPGRPPTRPGILGATGTDTKDTPPCSQRLHEHAGTLGFSLRRCCRRQPGRLPSPGTFSKRPCSGAAPYPPWLFLPSNLPRPLERSPTLPGYFPPWNDQVPLSGRLPPPGDLFLIRSPTLPEGFF